MATIEYRMYFNDEAATQEQLDRVEEIKVEQEVDMAWEARIQIPVCVNNDGKWEGEDEEFMRAFNRVRVEVKIGDGSFTPLIDGPIVGFDGERSAQPGKSNVTLIVHDDSAFLNQQDEVARFENKTDSEIARQIFGEVPETAASTPDIEDTPAQPGNLPPVVIQRGTKMQILRALARRHGNYHAYVLPGAAAGQSIGAFRTYPTEPDGLPPMILLGEDRNIASFNVRNNERSPATVRAATLSITDKGITSSSSSFRDARLLGEEPAAGNTPNTATRLRRPGQNDSVALDSATAGDAAESGYSAVATGSVIPHCYQGVLSPYRVVLVKISDSALSVNYLITKVTHNLTRSTYTQEFTMKGNAVSAAAGGGAGAPQPSVDLQVSFNIQGSIF